MSKKILILGGSGNSGFLIANFLLQESDCKIVIAGRNLNKATKAASMLNTKFDYKRVEALKLDAANRESLDNAFLNIDMVVVASSTSLYMKEIVEAAISAGIDYLDINLTSKDKLKYLYSKKFAIEQKELCFITDGGFHPGVPAALVSYIAPEFERLNKANVYSIMKINWKKYLFSDDTILEMVREFKHYDMSIFKERKWRKFKNSDLKKIDFGKKFGFHLCYPMYLEEMRSLPEHYPSLLETGFYVAGFNRVVDYIILPFIIYLLLPLLGKFGLKLSANLFESGLKKYSAPPYGLILKLEAEGISSGKKKSIHISLSHNDGYYFTAIPVVACLIQYLDGTILPGLHFQANSVLPERFFVDIKRMGVEITKTTNS